VERIAISADWNPLSGPSIEGNSLRVPLAEVGYSKNKNYSGKPRTMTLKLTAGTLTQYINLTQSPGSHTCIAKVGAACIIPLRSANVDGEDRYAKIQKITYNYDDVVSVGIVVVMGPSVTVPASYLKKEGIVLVSAYDINGTDLLWTWTIWVVDNTVDFTRADMQRHYNGYTFMDRNLGTITTPSSSPWSKGLFYQWGRKDPAVDTTHVFVPPGVSLLESAKNPRAFYRSATAPYDWLDSQNNTLWTGIDGEKGLYDPCPFGWRVPPAGKDEASPFQGFKSGANNLQVPPAGGISGETGLDLPSALLLWGASARGTDAYLYDAEAVAHQKAHRTDACPIRCIRDVKRPGGSLIITNQT
jgi:hypothetical protein